MSSPNSVAAIPCPVTSSTWAAVIIPDTVPPGAGHVGVSAATAAGAEGQESSSSCCSSIGLNDGWLNHPDGPAASVHHPPAPWPKMLGKRPALAEGSRIGHRV